MYNFYFEIFEETLSIFDFLITNTKQIKLKVHVHALKNQG